MSRRAATVAGPRQSDPVVGRTVACGQAVGLFCDTGLVRPLDPRLMRYASGIRTLLIASVLLGIAAAVVVIVQAVLIAGILAEVIIDGQGVAAVSAKLGWLAAVFAVRAGLAWATEEIA